MLTCFVPLLDLLELLDRIGLLVSIDNLVVRLAHQHKVLESVPLLFSLLRVKPRSLRARSLDVTDLPSDDFLMDERRRTPRERAAVTLERVKTLDRARARP